MAERMVGTWQRLFEIRILHHYWLDDGDVIFDLIPDQSTRESHLSAYDARPLLDVSPTTSTGTSLNGWGCIWKNTALGLVVLAPAEAVFLDDCVFEFQVSILDSAFFNYTALTFRPRKIYELYYASEDKTYRYKENVPVLSNLTGASRISGVDKVLYLSGETPVINPDDQVESLITAGNALMQLTGDQPGAAVQLLGTQAADLPVFVHQGDVPPIIPPAGLSGAPPRGVLLTDDVSDDVFAMLRLTTVRASDGDFSFIGADGKAKPVNPVYHVRFKNRSTFRKYYDKSTNAPVFSEPGPLPLSFHGNSGTRQKPSEGFVKPEQSGTRITKLVSEIFV